MLVILSGVAGAGKDTIKNKLIEKNSNYTTLPSYTSRNPRATDIPNVTYNFVTKEQSEEMINNNELYEYSLHHNNYYGTSKKLLQEKLNEGKIIIKDIDVNGTEDLINLLKNEVKILTIFLKVSKEELLNRLNNRNDHLSQEEIKMRLSRLEYEESKIPLYDYVIDNNNLDETIIKIEEIINKNIWY